MSVPSLEGHLPRDWGVWEDGAVKISGIGFFETFELRSTWFRPDGTYSSHESFVQGGVGERGGRTVFINFVAKMIKGLLNRKQFPKVRALE